jgi:hypothetical protein
MTVSSLVFNVWEAQSGLYHGKRSDGTPPDGLPAFVTRL